MLHPVFLLVVVVGGICIVKLTGQGSACQGSYRSVLLKAFCIWSKEETLFICCPFIVGTVPVFKWTLVEQMPKVIKLGSHSSYIQVLMLGTQEFHLAKETLQLWSLWGLGGREMFQMIWVPSKCRYRHTYHWEAWRSVPTEGKGVLVRAGAPGRVAVQPWVKMSVASRSCEKQGIHFLLEQQGRTSSIAMLILVHDTNFLLLISRTRRE